MVPGDSIAGACLLAVVNGTGEIPVFQHFVVAGGWVTWFVLIPLSFIALTLAVHYALTIRRKAMIPPELVRQLEAALVAGRPDAAADAARADGRMLGNVMDAGLRRLRDGPEAVRTALDATLEEQTARLMRKVELLNIVGNVSPMVGLFGTVVGMIRAFNRMAGMEGGMANASNAAKLSGDISIAFVNTFWGLAVAVPALVVFAIFRMRVEAAADECGSVAERLLNLLPGHPVAGRMPSEGEPAGRGVRAQPAGT